MNQVLMYFWFLFSWTFPNTNTGGKVWKFLFFSYVPDSQHWREGGITPFSPDLPLYWRAWYLLLELQVL